MRRAAVTVSIKGHDVTLDLMPYLVSLTYTDKADEELDDLQIVLEDDEDPAAVKALFKDLAEYLEIDDED